MAAQESDLTKEGSTENVTSKEKQIAHTDIEFMNDHVLAMILQSASGQQAECIGEAIKCRKVLMELRGQGKQESRSMKELLALVQFCIPAHAIGARGGSGKMGSWGFYGVIYVRSLFTEVISWSIPSRLALDKIVEFVAGDTVLEVGAGRGFWSGLLQSTGLDVICTSRDISHRGEGLSELTWIEVELLTANEAVAKYPDRGCLFVSWGQGTLPDLDQFKGTKLVVIGENDTGCTDYVEDGTSGFKLVDKIKIPCWTGLMDKLRFYQRYL